MVNLNAGNDRSARTVARYFLNWAEENGNHNGITNLIMDEILNIAQSVSRNWYNRNVFEPKTQWQTYPERIDMKFNPKDYFTRQELDLLNAVAEVNIEKNTKPLVKKYFINDISASKLAAKRYMRH